MNAKEFLNTKGITKATCYTDNGTYYFNELADILEDFLKAQDKQKLNIHGVSGKLPELLDIYNIIDKHSRYEINDKTFLEMLRAAYVNDAVETVAEVVV